VEWAALAPQLELDVTPWKSIQPEKITSNSGLKKNTKFGTKAEEKCLKASSHPYF
jgi:hypothetical protein